MLLGKCYQARERQGEISMATLTRPVRMSPAYEARRQRLHMPVNPIARLEEALEKRTLEVAVLEYFWDR